ncbi:MAG: hypothetical protein GY856_34470, partial [bacterium]|nr:hypothetical protein [bacterium]
MSANKLPGCFKYGCIGCLSLFALLVGLILLMGAIQISMDQDPNPEEVRLAHELPPVPESPTYPRGDEPEIPEVLPLPEELDLAITPASGKIILDVSMGEFIIRPGPANEPIRVVADYDSNAFELTEDFTSSDDSWSYELSFGGRGGLLGMLFRGSNAGHNRVELIIPRGYPVEIVGEIGFGESETDLGGLSVERVDLGYRAGDHLLEFQEPTAVPMEEFRVDSSMGSFEVHDLGNASPKAIVMDHGMGELFLDLRGEWRGDATADIEFSMGECRVRLPDNVRVEIERARVSMGEKMIDSGSDQDLPPDAPT